MTMREPDGVEGWCHGRADCEQCGHEWVGVWPLDADNLQCPSCGSTETNRYAEA